MQKYFGMQQNWGEFENSYYWYTEIPIDVWKEMMQTDSGSEHTDHPPVYYASSTMCMYKSGVYGYEKTAHKVYNVYRLCKFKDKPEQERPKFLGED